MKRGDAAVGQGTVADSRGQPEQITEQPTLLAHPIDPSPPPLVNAATVSSIAIDSGFGDLSYSIGPSGAGTR